MELKSLRINLLYLSNQGVPIRLEDIIVGHDFFLPEDIESEVSFSNILGGVELITNEHLIFYQSFDLYDLEKGVVFLLSSIEEEFSSGLKAELKLQNENTNTLIIKKKGNILEISYNELFGKISPARNNFSFSNITVSYFLWKTAVLSALEEYFKLFEFKILSKKINIHSKLFSIWKKVSEE